MIKINAGKLRAIGYDAPTRTLHIELEGGDGLAYSAVGESIWRHFKASGNQWSYYRDNIEEEYSARSIAVHKTRTQQKNPLDDLFK